MAMRKIENSVLKCDIRRIIHISHAIENSFLMLNVE